MNPFITSTYTGQEYFIDRKQESGKLIDAIQNERNLTLFSHRRLGKTLLLHHIFSLIDHKSYTPLFVDLFATRNMVHFAQKLTEALYEKKILQQNRLARILGSLGASVSFDPLTGSPQISFNVKEPSAVLKSIPELFRLLSRHKKKVILALDEFQEVARYEGDYSEATIRTLMQDFPSIGFIFSGSRMSLMKEIFTDASRPFFQSTQMMELHEIDREIYTGEVHALLTRYQQKFDPLVIDRIMEDTYCHTGFTQMVLSRVFSEAEHRIDFELYERVWSDILDNHKSMAREQEFLLPELQWKTLHAVAREGYVKFPQSKGFAMEYGLSVPSSMSRAIKALLDKGLIIDCADRGLRVYNVFIEKALREIPF
ncbi:MAG: ATP-binding protein [Bacteroidota bacterium]